MFQSYTMGIKIKHDEKKLPTLVNILFLEDFSSIQIFSFLSSISETLSNIWQIYIEILNKENGLDAD